MSRKALVAGWFSFPYMGATAGDLLARDLVCRWLDEAGVEHDVACLPVFGEGVDWEQADPAAYYHLVFVCGPFGNGPPVDAMLHRFASCRAVGVNLSMLEPLDVWNPFDALFERDSSRAAHPDVTFLSAQDLVPVVGLVLVHPQKEYGGRALHREANEALRALTESREMAVVPIDTCLDPNTTGLRSPAEVESLIARMDAVLTTRLHGTVLALKNGVPALAVDPIRGGAKVLRQAETLGWPAAFSTDSLSPGALREALAFCLSPEGKAAAAAVPSRAGAMLADLREAFLSAVAVSDPASPGSP